MGRFGDFTRDVAHYFAVGENSGRRDGSLEPEANERWYETSLGVLPVLIVGFTLREILGLGDDFRGFLLTLGLFVVLGIVWGLLLRARSARGHRRNPRSDA